MGLVQVKMALLVPDVSLLHLSIHIVRVLCETFLRPIMYRPKMGIVKAIKLGAKSKILLFSLTVQDYRYRLADICLVMHAVGQAGHSRESYNL